MSDTAACRILVISPSASRAHQFVERVQALCASRTDATERVQESVATPVSDEGGLSTSVSSTLGGSKDPISSGSSSSIPWTIVNRYYTADVHFETHEFEHFRVHHAIGVPAVIYVWGHGEPFKEHIPEIAQKIQHYNPEVSLAVRLTGNSSSAVALTITEEEDGLDEFTSSHGFEFIEGERAYRRPTQDLDRHSDDEDTGIPGLPRVIDALSTIMWPSLVQSQATRQRKSRARELLGWALEEEADDGLRALIPVPTTPAAGPTQATPAAENARKSRMQREMEELERWLEDEETGSGLQYSRAQANGKAPEAPADGADSDEKAREWVTSAPVTSVEGWEDMMATPAIRTPRPDDDFHHAALGAEHGFEDDFADFVSATSGPHGLLQPHGFGLDHGDNRLLEVNYDVARLTPMHTGASYRSLASVSDFGGEESLYVGREELHEGAYGALVDEDEDDPDLPSRAEILETSRRLFGAAASMPPSESQVSSSAATPASSSSASITPESQRDASVTPPDSIRLPASTLEADSSAGLSLDSEDGDDHAFAAFDLSRVFNALQGMKAEIAGMEDEEERRRAAARVALGLVYGLEAHSDESGHRASSS